MSVSTSISSSPSLRRRQRLASGLLLLVLCTVQGGGWPRALSGIKLAMAAANNEADLAPPSLSTKPIEVPSRILMGPGPSTAYPRVLAAGVLPLLGHMHPEFLGVMDEVREWLKYTFQTKNELTLAVSGSGHAAMEASVANVVEPGDKVVVGVNGIWGERMTVLAARHGADVKRMEVATGKTFSLKQIEETLDANPGTKVLFLVHGESSTGTLQNLDGVGEACSKRGVLLFLDTVCTLGGVPLKLDSWGVDISYSGSQKCLSVPPGASPISFSEKAQAKIAARKTPIQSYYFDMNMVGNYWGVGAPPRGYHHTALVTNIYQLREGLAILAEEGLNAAWERHHKMADMLYAGLASLGLKLFVEDPKDRLPTVTTIVVPEGIVWNSVTGYIMKKYDLEIAGGLGPTVGKVWRVGIMGYNARPQTITLVIEAFRDALTHFGYKIPQECVASQ